LANSVFALFAPFIIWAIGKLIFRATNSASGGLWAGPIIGLITALIVYSQMKPRFLAITNLELDDGRFLYSGFLSGAIAGELCHRYYLSVAGVQATSEGLRLRFFDFRFPL
jgi:hypothetical protein